MIEIKNLNELKIGDWVKVYDKNTQVVHYKIGEITHKWKEKNKEEPEIITFKEIIERHKDVKEEELHKIVLICKNCNHKDLLKNFIKKKSSSWNNLIRPTKPSEPSPNPFKPYKPQPYKPKRYRCEKTTAKSIKMMIMINSEDYEDMFFCPKCNSSLVVLCKEFTKNNIARTI